MLSDINFLLIAYSLQNQGYEKAKMPNTTDIDARLHLFKDDLSRLSPLQIIRKHIIFGDCAVITNPQYFELRTVIAEKFQVHPNEVLIVGSAKLGFSIAPAKRYRPFSDTSDIDVVIVSATLFNGIWQSVLKYQKSGGYWERFDDFKKYLFQGWIRPDKLPPEKSFQFANEWWTFFNDISSSGKYSEYKIAGALYQNWHFLEMYQYNGVSDCIDDAQRIASGGNKE